MKIWIVFLMFAVFLAGPVSGQSIDFEDLQGYFKTFSGDVAQSLPFAAASTGLTWSDARVMGFPRFGVGLSVAAVTVPKDAFESVAEGLGFSLPPEIGGFGVPLPGYSLDARVGIPLLPVDIGAKVGYLSPGMGKELEGACGVAAEYVLAGLEVRYPLLKGRLMLPALSVAAGYTYLNGSVSMAAPGIGDTIDFGGGNTITVTNPDVRFAWKTHALDFNAQVSKGILLFTPYLGAGYSYGWSEAGGGIKSDLVYGGLTTKEEFESTYDITIDDQGFLVYSSASGGSFRAYGGVSLNLLVLRLDLNAQYNFTTKSPGGGLNVRIQF